MPAVRGRDQRLDMFRGLALVMIFINHVPGTIYELFTSRNFGFSDAAEGFVLMSGIAAGLAYSPQFASGPLWPAVARVWARARTLYFVHIATTMLALGIFAAAALWFGLTEVLGRNNVPPLFQHPLESMIGLPLLTHQLGYFNILPLYLVLMLTAPLYIIGALRAPRLTLGLAIALWAVAGQFRLNLPNYPTSGGWFFNPLSWQLIFAFGLFGGIAMRQGRSFVPLRTGWFLGALAFLVVVMAWVMIPQIGAVGRNILGWFSGLGLPFYITWFDKTFLALPRLVHALALAYVLASIPQVRSFAESAYAKPLTLLGRHGLAIFATGSVLSMVLQSIKEAVPQNWISDGALFAGGLSIQLLLAYVLDRSKAAKTRRHAPESAATEVDPVLVGTPAAGRS